MPGFSEITVIVDPRGEVKPKAPVSIIMPWLYAPWPEAQRAGTALTEIEGETLRELLSGLAKRYQQAGVDFEPINPKTSDLDFDYSLLVNGQDYLTLPHGLDTKLSPGDEVKVKMLWRWDG